MKVLGPILLLMLFSSCSLKDALDTGAGRAETSINPIAEAKPLAEDVLGSQSKGGGAVITVKVPLSESSIDHFELDTIIEGDSRSKNFFKKLWRELKLSFANLALGFGIQNQAKFSTVLPLPEIDPKYFKTAKIKRVFFTTEDCRENERNCHGIKGEESNFSLVDKFMINVDEYIPERDGNLLDESKMTHLVGREHKEERELTLDSLGVDVIEEVESLNFPTEVRGSKSNGLGINILSFYNDLPYIKFKERNGALSIKISDVKERARVRNYLTSEKFSGMIKKVYLRSKMSSNFGGLTSRSEIIVILKDGVSSEDLYREINKDQSPALANMIIFRLSGKGKETKRFFSKEKYKSHIKGMTMINRSLFVEVYNGKKFLSLIEEDKENIEKELDIYKVQKCNISTCLDLKAKDINLVPLAVKSPNIKVDTYVSIRSLGNIDFKYNGYIEVEITLDLPL